MKIDELIKSLENASLRFELFDEQKVLILEGYQSFLSTASSYPNLRLSKQYQLFYKATRTRFEEFKALYEHINVRTYSEAICETIGSMMGQSCANGRNLEPANLNKEVRLEFNLPPYHVLVDDFIPTITQKW